MGATALRIAGLSALGLTAAAWVSTPALAQQVAPPTSPEPALGDPMPDRIVGFPGGVSAYNDVVFSVIPGFRPLTLDLYRVPTVREARPLVVYIHGGGWMAGHTRQSGAFSNFPGVLAELSARGYVVASLEYRLSREAPFPAAIDDVRAAIRFLRANAAKYGIDPTRVAVWGGSAGGQLAALAALDCAHSPRGDDKANADQSECVQAGVSWYGVHDFATMPRDAIPRAENRYLDCLPNQCPPDRIWAASAAAHVDAKDPPMLILHGTADKTVPVTQSEELAAKMKAAGAPYEITLFPGIGHSWLGAGPAETRDASIKAVNLTFDFFDRKLRGKK
ncbi:alpha/beta hydrolase [Sphingomonas sp. BGYR3]|uniref:alpha/beta hydrolase n=1 Tax=Sphingomonas sp. BGYR3 TaxID=2975483 RepID=UPI0021A89142|nr:alpha/beta hydrolase [Sphingomonas sp. BGYR3]MDG5489666.1 alpha/beta hydrolase [Sphingomonas sp. BGYR3]